MGEIEDRVRRLHAAKAQSAADERGRQDRAHQAGLTAMLHELLRDGPRAAQLLAQHDLAGAVLVKQGRFRSDIAAWEATIYDIGSGDVSHWQRVYLISDGRFCEQQTGRIVKVTEQTRWLSGAVEFVRDVIRRYPE